MNSRTLTRPAIALLLVALLFADVASDFETTMGFSAMSNVLDEYRHPSATWWVVSAYVLTGAVGAVVVGRLGDRFGRRRVLLIMLACSGLGALICALAHGYLDVIIGRFMQGLSGAMLALTLGIARETLGPKQLPTSVGVITTTQTLGGALGLLSGGLIVDHFGWRRKRWASVGFMIVSLILVSLFVPDSKGAKDRPRVDLRQLISPQLLLPNFAVALCALGALHHPQIFLRVMQQPVLTGVGPGLSLTLACGLQIPGAALMAAGSPLTSRAVTRWGGGRAIMGGMIVAAAACLAVMLAPQHLWLMAACAILTALGVGLVYVAVPNLLIAISPIERTSETIGVFAAVRTSAMGFGSWVVLALLAASATHASGAPPTLAGFRLALGLVAATCLACAVVAWVLTRSNRPGAERPA